MMRRPSFQFYPADWRGSRWITFEVATAIFPRKPCCYAVYLDGELAYVGQCRDMAARMSAHRLRLGYGSSVLAKWGAFKSVVVKARFTSKNGDWAAREIRLIDRLQPRLNCVGGPRARRLA